MMLKRSVTYLTMIMVAAGVFSGCLSGKESKACIRAACLNVEIAQTNDELERGLQYRQSMPRGQGMLFVFPQDVEAGFWMKNTLLPLDMIWLNSSRKVVYIEKNAPPCLQEDCPVYGPKEAIRYVLEANAGFADANNIQLGDEGTLLIAGEKVR